MPIMIPSNLKLTSCTKTFSELLDFYQWAKFNAHFNTYQLNKWTYETQSYEALSEIIEFCKYWVKLESVFDRIARTVYFK